MWSTYFSRRKKTPNLVIVFCLMLHKNTCSLILQIIKLLCNTCFQKLHHSKDKIVFICRRNVGCCGMCQGGWDQKDSRIVMTVISITSLVFSLFLFTSLGMCSSSSSSESLATLESWTVVRLHTKTFYKIIICLFFWFRAHAHVWPLPFQKRTLPKTERKGKVRIWCHVNTPQSK